MKNHLINKDKTLLEALSQINDLAPEPLVLFVIDENERMVGTLTDGDSRRALIAGASVNDKAEIIMHRNFNYMRVDDVDNVLELRHQKEMKMEGRKGSYILLAMAMEILALYQNLGSWIYQTKGHLPDGTPVKGTFMNHLNWLDPNHNYIFEYTRQLLTIMWIG